MPSDFVPFLQSVTARLASSPSSSESSPPQTAAGLPRPTHIPQSEVKVELKRDGDRISQIRIHCRCGELIELNCDY